MGLLNTIVHEAVLVNNNHTNATRVTLALTIGCQFLYTIVLNGAQSPDRAR